MKKLRISLAILFAAALMVTIMAVPAFATTYYTSGEAPYYYIGSEDSYKTTSAVTVTLYVQSKRTGTYNTPYIDQKYTVTIPASSTPRAVTVSQVLIKAATNNTGLYFKDYYNNNITSSSPYCHHVIYGGNTYAPVPDGHTPPAYWNGWSFTINGKYPLNSGTPATTLLDSEDGDAEGTAINYAYVNDGDVINFFFNDINSYSAAADHLRIQSASYNSSTNKFSVQVETCRSWHVETAPDTYVWHIKGYESMGSATVKIYNSSNTQVAYGTTNSSGLAELSATGTISSGTYKVVTTWKHRFVSYGGYGSYYMLGQTHTEEKLTI